jgi:hypothetical protein
MPDDKTIFATHPVDPAIKREANAAGFRLVDARFAPEGSRLMDGQTGQPIGEDPVEPVDPDTLTTGGTETTPEPTVEPAPAAEPEQPARKGKAPASE